MKPMLIALLLGTLLLALAWPAFAEPFKPVSGKPLYAGVVCKQDASKVLRLVFDESTGTGQGYDTLWADLNFDGQLSAGEKVKGELQKNGDFRFCSFPTLLVRVPYSTDASSGGIPTRLGISYYSTKPGAPGDFRLQTTLTWPAGGVNWDYSFMGSLAVSERPEGLVASRCGGDILVDVDVRPDPQRPGYVGLAANLSAEGSYLRVSRSDRPLMVHVKITNEQGGLLREEDVALDSMAFG